MVTRDRIGETDSDAGSGLSWRFDSAPSLYIPKYTMLSDTGVFHYVAELAAPAPSETWTLTTRRKIVPRLFKPEPVKVLKSKAPSKAEQARRIADFHPTCIRHFAIKQIALGKGFKRSEVVTEVLGSNLRAGQDLPLDFYKVHREDGVSVDEFIHEVWPEYAGRMRSHYRDSDELTDRNVVHDVISSYTTRAAAQAEILRLASLDDINEAMPPEYWRTVGPDELLRALDQGYITDAEYESYSGQIPQVSDDYVPF